MSAAVATPSAPAQAQTSPPPAAPTEDPAFWDAEPGTEIERPPLFLVVIAEAGLGKSHLGLTFPGPVVVLDTEFRADEVLRKFRNVEKFWKKVESWSDIREAASRALKRYAKTPGTFVFDSGSDLNLLAEAEVLAELAAAGKGAHKTLHWGPVNKRFKGLFGTLRDRRWNAVFTARLKDEWKGEDRTGARVPGGFVTDKLVYHADFAVRLERGPDGKRVGRVLKNGARKVGTYAEVLSDEQLSYAGIIAEMEAGSAVQVLVPASPVQGPAPVPVPAPAPVPTPTPTPTQNTPTAAPAPGTVPGPAAGALPSSVPSLSQVGAASGATPATAPTTSPASAPAPAPSSGAAMLGEALLHSLGFKKTGAKVDEELDLDRASTLAHQWDAARAKSMPHVMREAAAALAQGGWFREPEAAAKAQAQAQATPAAPAPKKVEASTPAQAAPVDLAPPELVAELEALAVAIGSTRDSFWARMKAKGWSTGPGALRLDGAREAKKLLEAAAAASAAKQKTAAAAA